MAERTDFHGALTRNRKAIEAKHQELLDKQREDGGLLDKYAEYLSDFDRITAGKENALRAVEEKRAVVQSIIDEEQTAVQTSETKLREKTQTRPEDELVAGQREQTKRRYDAAVSKKEQYEELFRQFEALMKARAELIRELEELQDKISGARAASRDTLIGRLNEFDVPELAISILVDAGADRSRCEYFMQEEGFLTRDDFGQYASPEYFDGTRLYDAASIEPDV